MKYQKLPVIIDAVRWFKHGDHPDVIPAAGYLPQFGYISTLEGGHIVTPGDWIITGVAGEKYPCKPDIFALTYKPQQAEDFTMDFSSALQQLKTGSKLARAGWNGKAMFIFLVPGSQFKVSRPPLLGIYPEGTDIDYSPHVDMRTADGKIVPWLCSQTDMMAEDWSTVA